MNHFWNGFEKRALQETRSMEDLAVGASALAPFGTTLHTVLKDKAGKNSGKEWLARIGGSIAGSTLGGVIGAAVSKGDPLWHYTGSLAGVAGGEILASRLVHSGKYDEKGRLKAEYGGKQDVQETPDQG